MVSAKIVGAALVLIGAMLAEPLHADTASISQDERITERMAQLNVEGVLIKDALTKLSSTAGVPIVFSPSLLPESHVTCMCATRTVAAVIEHLLEGTAFKGTEVGNRIVIEAHPAPSGSEVVRTVSWERPSAQMPTIRRLPVQPVSGLVRQGAVRGQVVDQSTQQPIAGVQVDAEGTGIGVMTSADGQYMLANLPTGNVTIRARSLGYAQVTQEVTVVSGQTVDLNFTLSRQVLALDEVVVTGTAGGTQRRAVGNVVSQINMTDLMQNSPAVRIEEAIGNRVAGVRIMAPPSVAGGGAKISIRGSSSMALDGEPLIYVDGIRLRTDDAFADWNSSTSRLQDIDPSTIESVEIIKGPAAATLYGTEASNGVIQITTKRGEVGTPTFDATVEGGVNWWSDPAGRMGLQYWRDPSTNEIRSWNLYELEQQPDRFGRAPLTYGPIQRYNITARGGTELFRYSVGFNRSDMRGITRIDRDQRNRVHAAITVLPRDDLTFNISTSRTSGVTRGGEMSGAFVCRMSCYADPGSIDDEGRGWWIGRPAEAYIFGRFDDRHSSRTNWSVEVTHQPTDWFTHRFQGGLDEASTRRVLFTPQDPEGWGRFWGNAGALGQKSVSDNQSPTRTLDYAGTVALALTDRLGAATSFGFQYYNTQSRSLSASGSEFAIPTQSTVSATGDPSGGETFSENTTAGVYLQNQFDWDRRIFLTAAVRFDDNSAFGEDFDAAVYPKVSATWVISEEEFWRPDFLSISELRLRSAWGEAGQQPSTFASRTSYTVGTGPGGRPVLRYNSLGNPDLGPEKGSELEFGFDAALLNGRLELEFTRYSRVTKDALVRVPIRPSDGFPGEQWMNVGQTRNWGTETQLHAHIWNQGPVRWTMGLGLTTMGNRIDEMGPLGEVPATLSAAVARGQSHVEGYPIASIFTHRVVSADFVSGNSGAVTNVMCDGGTGRNGRNRGGVAVPCDQAPTVFMGQVDPSWLINLHSSWSIRDNWHLSATVDAAGGHHMNADYLGGRNTRHTRNLVYQDNAIFNANQTWSRTAGVTHRAGFMKLRELTLRYNLPVGLAERVGASRASISGTAYNVATLWEEAKFTPDGQRVFDQEMVDPAAPYPGSPRGAGPPLSHATVRVNVTF